MDKLRASSLFKKPIDQLSLLEFAQLRQFPFVLLQEKFLDSDFGTRLYPVKDLKRHPLNLRQTTAEGVARMKYVEPITWEHFLS